MHRSAIKMGGGGGAGWLAWNIKYLFVKSPTKHSTELKKSGIFLCGSFAYSVLLMFFFCFFCIFTIMLQGAAAVLTSALILV